jgi:hypothetical protein
VSIYHSYLFIAKNWETLGKKFKWRDISSNPEKKDAFKKIKGADPLDQNVRRFFLFAATI